MTLKKARKVNMKIGRVIVKVRKKIDAISKKLDERISKINEDFVLYNMKIIAILLVMAYSILMVIS